MLDTQILIVMTNLLSLNWIYLIDLQFIVWKQLSIYSKQYHPSDPRYDMSKFNRKWDVIEFFFIVATVTFDIFSTKNTIGFFLK